jgi:hypothetical protein
MNNSAKTTTIIFLIIFVIVSIAPQIFKSYFVHSTGNIKIIGGVMGLLIASLIYYKWKYVKYLFYIIMGTTVIFDLLILNQGKVIVGSTFIVLFILHLALLFYFMFSKNIKIYLAN